MIVDSAAVLLGGHDVFDEHGIARRRRTRGWSQCIRQVPPPHEVVADHMRPYNAERPFRASGQALEK